MEKPSIILLTTLHDIRNIRRYRENKRTIMGNCENEFISKIIVFFENYDKCDSDKYKFLQREKIEVINVETHQTYEMMFNHANNMLSGSIIIIANTDILFDDSISRIHEVDFSDVDLCAITRWESSGYSDMEYRMTLQKGKNNAFSFDSYIFKSPIEFSAGTLDLNVGYTGCDSLLVKRLCYDNMKKLINPCLDIITYHFDEPNRERTYVSGNRSYWNLPDYPAPWNRQYEIQLEQSKCKTPSVHGLPVCHTNGQVDVREYGVKSFDELKMKKKLNVIGFSLWGTQLVA